MPEVRKIERPETVSRLTRVVPRPPEERRNQLEEHERGGLACRDRGVHRTRRGQVAWCPGHVLGRRS